MRDYLGYQIVKVSASISEDKLRKSVRSGKITFSAEDLKGSKPLLVHPMCAKLILKAQSKNKGLTSMMIAGSDIINDMAFYGSKSIWNFMNEMKTKRAYNWIWDVVE